MNSALRTERIILAVAMFIIVKTILPDVAMPIVGNVAFFGACCIASVALVKRDMDL